MGASINLRHIVINRDKSRGLEYLQRLLDYGIGARILQSNIIYEQTKNYLKFEYFSKSIPPLIYDNSLFEGEDIMTIYSSDLGDKDSLIIFGSDWNGKFEYEPCYYKFDKIEITGKYDEIKTFNKYLYLENINPPVRETWCKKTQGELILQTINDRKCFSGIFPNYMLIEDKKTDKPLLENENCWISSIKCEDKLINQRFESILVEMFHHPEYYGNNIYTVKFSHQDEIIFKAKFDKSKQRWIFFQPGNMWKMISNEKLKKKAYH